MWLGGLDTATRRSYTLTHRIDDAITHTDLLQPQADVDGLIVRAAQDLRVRLGPNAGGGEGKGGR